MNSSTSSQAAGDAQTSQKDKNEGDKKGKDLAAKKGKDDKKGKNDKNGGKKKGDKKKANKQANKKDTPAVADGNTRKRSCKCHFSV